MRKRPVIDASFGVRWTQTLQPDLNDVISPGFIEAPSHEHPGQQMAPATPGFLKEYAQGGGSVIASGPGLVTDGFPRREVLVAQRELAQVVGATFVTEMLDDDGTPLFTRHRLDTLVENVRICQDVLGLPVAVSTTQCGAAGDIAGPDFLRELTSRTGCWLVVDIADLVRRCRAAGRCPQPLIDRLPMDDVAYLRFSCPRGGAAMNDDALSTLQYAWVSHGQVPVLLDRPLTSSGQLVADLLSLSQALVGATARHRERALA